MANEMISTALMDDPDPEGTDVYGILPLISVIVEDDEDNDDDAMGDDDDEEALIGPSSLEIKVPKGKEMPDEDDEAFMALTSNRDTDLSPGEAEDLIEYMRPLSEDEREFIATTPFINDLRWVDDPAHIADVLKAGKDSRGMDTFLRDASYGDAMNEDELANLNDSDKFAGWKNMGLETQRPAQLVKVAKPIPTTVKIQHANRAVVNDLHKKMVVEHANWLADQDKAQGITVRPRAYYENVARLWTVSKLKGAEIPISSSGNWKASPKSMIGKANGILATTEKERSRYSFALGLDDSLGGLGWNPIKSIKSAVKSTVRSVGQGAKKGASFGYRIAKKTALAPIKYTYKGIKYVGDKALQLALRPIKAIVRRYTNTIINRRANALAKQRGLKVPGPTEKTEASLWAKQFVRNKGGKYGGAIASLMGAEYGIHQVDLSLGVLNDEMGLSKTAASGLILLGPLGIIAVLTGLIKLSSPAAPPPEPGSEEAAAEAADAQSADAQSDEEQTSDGTTDTAPADASEYASDDASYGWTSAFKKRNQRKQVTIEQLNRMNTKKRAYMQKLIQSGRIRLV